jgi:hypothetical protein
MLKKVFHSLLTRRKSPRRLLFVHHQVLHRTRRSKDCWALEGKSRNVARSLTEDLPGGEGGSWLQAIAQSRRCDVECETYLNTFNRRLARICEDGLGMDKSGSFVATVFCRILESAPTAVECSVIMNRFRDLVVLLGGSAGSSASKDSLIIAL